nr:MAG TPA: hypothetical protein [Caudoviricetes sp.]
MISLSFYLVLTFFLNTYLEIMGRVFATLFSPSYRKPCPFGNIF